MNKKCINPHFWSILAAALNGVPTFGATVAWWDLVAWCQRCVECFLLYLPLSIFIFAVVLRWKAIANIMYSEHISNQLEATKTTKCHVHHRPYAHWWTLLYYWRFPTSSMPTSMSASTFLTIQYGGLHHSVAVAVVVLRREGGDDDGCVSIHSSWGMHWPLASCESVGRERNGMVSTLGW